MSYNEEVLSVKNVNKCFEIYEKPSRRLLQMFLKSKKFYTEYWALKNINFSVLKGESVGIIGRNGAGKSTLLQIICNTLQPSSGNVYIDGKVAALLELGAGFNPEFTGRDNVYLCASLYGLSQSEVDDRFEQIVDFASIGEFINQPVKTYSSGMYVRLAFAVIAHVNADILIIDEALAVGDALFTQKCMRFLRNFKKTGVLFFVSHDTSAVTNLCDKALWLEKGAMLAFGEAKIVTEKYMASLYNSKIRNEKTKGNVPLKKYYRDFRLDIINSSNLRNDIQIVQFSESKSNDFGQGSARISDVFLADEMGNSYSWFVGGELVFLIIDINVLSLLNNPIVGFTVKDKLGQPIFGDNTFLSTIDDDISCNSGDTIRVKFEFFMPILMNGDYSLSVAIADGTQETHVQHHWINDALIFKSTSTSASTGLIGIPMNSIGFTINV